ncbi:MAG: toprim domain-containing protein [Bdellovibrionales bacterium]
MIDFNETKPFGSFAAHIDLDAVVSILRDQASHWVPAHFPSGKQSGKDWRVANIKGDAPYKQGSCAIKLQGSHAGDWYEFDSNQGGGPIGTLGHATGLSGRFLIEYAAELSGWKVGDKKYPTPRPEQQSQNSQNEIRYILSGCQLAAGTHVQTYLEARGLKLPDTQDLLFHPDLAHWETNMGYPAMVALARDAQDQAVGIHRIWLALDGKSKADVPKAKMMLGPVAGGAVHLGQKANELVGVSEGIETGLAVVQSVPHLPVWASLSTSGMEKLRLPSNIRRVILLADNDKSGAGLRSAEATAKRLVSEGRRVWIAMPPQAGEDFNDLLLRKGSLLVANIVEQSAEYKNEDLPLVDPTPKMEIKHLPHRPFGFDDTHSIKPVMQSDDGDLASLAEQCWYRIYETNKPPWLFRFSLLPTWVDLDDDGRPKPQTITEDRMKFILARQIDWRRKLKDRLIPAHPPAAVIKDILATPHTNLPVLGGIVSTPVFGPDGKIIQVPGYYKAAKLFYVPQKDFVLPAIPQNPSAEEIKAARDLIVNDLFGDFPFLGEAELAHAVALLLLPFVRSMIAGPTPIHLFEKPTPGTGASLLVEIIAIIATGMSAKVMTEGRSEEEWRKRLTSALRAMPALLFIDNLRYRLDSAALAAAVTATSWEDRILGRSELANFPVRCAWVVTGNNPALSNEMARRAIRTRLDARVDQPWRRSGFRHKNLAKWVQDNRPQLVAACLTLVQGWVSAGQPAQPQSLGSFEEWSRVIGGILGFAGIPGFLTNLNDLYDASDEEGSLWRSFITAWWERFTDRDVSTGELYQLVEDRDIALPLGKGSEQSRRIRLGKQLAKMRDRVFEIEEGRSVTLVSGRMRQRALTWQLAVSENLSGVKHSQHSLPYKKYGECVSVENPHSPPHSLEISLTDQDAGECSECGECFSNTYARAHAHTQSNPVKHSLTPPHSLTPSEQKDFRSECLSECQNDTHKGSLPSWLEEMGDQLSPNMAKRIAEQSVPNSSTIKKGEADES